jgi:EmrB/QacA subfamily drug resistance transporter
MAETDEIELAPMVKYQTLLMVGAGVFLSTLDSSMVNVALPFIMATFGAQLIEVQWVVLIYLLSITVTLLFWGIVSDRIGKHITYLSGIALFVLSSVGCSLAPSLPALVALRFSEGLGAAMMMAAGPTIVRDIFPRNQLGRGLGLVGIATSAGLMSGPVVGGLLISSFSWRAIFLVSVPFGLLVFLSGLVIFKRPGIIKAVAQPRQFDLKGALLWACLVSSTVVYAHFLMRLQAVEKILGALLLAVLLALFYLAEKTRKSNILPLHLFARKYYHIGLITAALSFGSLFVVLVLMPFYLKYVKGLSADLVGLVMMAVPLTLFFVSPTAGLLYDRLGSRYLTTLGLSIGTLALLMLMMIGKDTNFIAICMILALLGMGQSMFLAPNTASLLSRIPDVDAGITSGLLATSRNLGMLAGAAFGSMVFAAWYGYFSAGSELRHYRPEFAEAFILALRATLFCASVISALNVYISWQRRR